jgi:hypothetical protein
MLLLADTHRRSSIDAASRTVTYDVYQVDHRDQAGQCLVARNTGKARPGSRKRPEALVFRVDFLALELLESVVYGSITQSPPQLHSHPHHKAARVPHRTNQRSASSWPVPCAKGNMVLNGLVKRSLTRSGARVEVAGLAI